MAPETADTALKPLTKERVSPWAASWGRESREVRRIQPRAFRLQPRGENSLVFSTFEVFALSPGIGCAFLGSGRCHASQCSELRSTMQSDSRRNPTPGQSALGRLAH